MIFESLGVGEMIPSRKANGEKRRVALTINSLAHILIVTGGLGGL